MARRHLAALVLAFSAALALTACSEEVAPAIDVPSEPDFEESLEDLASDLPADLTTDIQVIAPDATPADILDNSRSICQSAADGEDEETLARDAASLFGVEEAEGPTLVETISPYCNVIG